MGLLIVLLFYSLSYESGYIVALGAWSLPLGPCFVELRSLQLLAVDIYPGTKLLPGIAHDLELSCDGCQLAGRRVTYFYCEFFHISFIVSAGPELPPRTCVCFDKFNHRKSIKRGKTSSYHIWDRLSSLELGACGLQLFLIFFRPSKVHRASKLVGMTRLTWPRILVAQHSILRYSFCLSLCLYQIRSGRKLGALNIE